MTDSPLATLNKARSLTPCPLCKGRGQGVIQAFVMEEGKPLRHSFDQPSGRKCRSCKGSGKASVRQFAKLLATSSILRPNIRSCERYLAGKQPVPAGVLQAALRLIEKGEK